MRTDYEPSFYRELVKPRYFFRLRLDALSIGALTRSCFVQLARPYPPKFSVTSHSKPISMAIYSP